MKRILTLFAAIALTVSLSAQQYKMRITDRQGQQIANEGQVLFSDSNIVTIPFYTWNDSLNDEVYDPKQVPASKLHLIDFVTMSNRLWEPNYTPRITTYGNPDEFGYASVMHMRDLMTEDMACMESGYNWYNNILEANLLPTYRNVYIPWFYYIDAIMQCNEIIRIIGYEPVTNEDKAVLCEALITRAMLYLDFARMYEFLPNEKTTGLTETGYDVNGLTVPIIDENTKCTDGAYYAPRATKQQVADFITNDLYRADALVSNITTDSHEVPFADVICGLHARKAMWTGDYISAYLYARSALNLTTARPMTVDEMLSPTKGFNDISCWMWGVQQTSEKNCPDSYTNFVSWMSPEYEGYAELVPPMISRSLYDRISNSDPRKLLFIAPYDSPLSGKTPLNNKNSTYSPYTSVKFRPADGQYLWTNGGAFTAYPLMRVEEMCFIQAEALAYSEPAAALQLLNEFMRQYRDSTYHFSSTDPSELINEIILQKRIELWGEGQTFFDIKRLNMSVTRDYDGTNFHWASAINTIGRPWWMNVTIPDGASSSNLALYGCGNPQNNVDSRVWETLRFQQPAFLNDFAALPVDSAHYMLLHLSVPDELRNSSGLLEVSLSANFPMGMTAKLINFSTDDDNNADLMVPTRNLFNNVKAIAAVNDMPGTGYVRTYIRARVGDVVSSIIEIPVQMPKTHSLGVENFSYLPKVKATTVGLIDCEAVAGDSIVKVVNLSLQGEGDFFHTSSTTIGTIYYCDQRTNFAINSDGTTSNIYDEFNDRAFDVYDYILKRTELSKTYTDGMASVYVQHNDLVGNVLSNNFDVSLLFNRQRIAEEQYTWNLHASDMFFSEFKLEQNATKVTIEKAKTDNVQLYRILEPYQRNHNIMFTVNDSANINVQRQMALHDSTSGSVYVSGQGQVTPDGIYKFTLSFTDSIGNIIATCNEQIGEVSQWKTLGTGLIQENFWYETSVEVEIQVSLQDANRFRIVNPFNILNDAIGYYSPGTPSPYLDITLLKAGENFDGTDITQEGLVYFPPSNTGYYHTTYEQYVMLLHPSDYYSFHSQEYLLHNRVLSYQSDGQTPAQIQLAPNYFLEGVGGWNNTQIDGVFIITFPAISN